MNPFHLVKFIFVIPNLRCAVLYRHHCWTSFEGSAEVYNEVMRETSNYNVINLKLFLERYPIRHAVKAAGMVYYYLCL